jgi:glycosyltransferase involved in cell wall biosynthesis
MLNPLVSIVIPAYNHAEFLDEAIQSVLTQEYKNIELIVLNDGSTDHTAEILKKYGTSFYWETHANMGQANTLNKGWKISKGSILGYLSADDFLLPDAVGKSVAKLLEEPDAVLTYCDFNLVDLKSSFVRRVVSPVMTYQEMIVRLICPPGPGAFFRREAYELAGSWDSNLKQMPDYDYWLRLGMHGEFVHIPEVLAGFRVHEASQSFAKPSVEKANEPVLIISRFFKSNTSPDLAKLSDKALASAELVSAQLHFRADRYKDGFTSIKRSFSLAPRGLLSTRTYRVLFNALLNRIGHKILWRAKAILRKPLN